jgi:methionyl-tRNA formyltransferase
MRLLFAGTPEPAVPSLKALLGSRHEVVAALTRPDTHSGRRGTLAPSPVAVAADEAGLPVLKPASIRADEFAAEFAALRVDAVAVVAYGALIGEALLEAAPHGWINLHFSLLPAWRGAAPVQAAIRAGDDVTGASTFLIEKGLDTGPVFGTVTETIRPTDTTGDLLHRLSASGAALLVATFDGLADGTVTAVPQSADGVSHAPKVTVADAEVDFRLPALAIDRLIRSVTPAPGAWVASRWGRLGLGPVTVAADADVRPGPGEIVAGKRDVLIGTASVPVRLSTVQQPGKRAVPAADWARGARLQPGERWGEVTAATAPQPGQRA